MLLTEYEPVHTYTRVPFHKTCLSIAGVKIQRQILAVTLTYSLFVLIDFILCIQITNTWLYKQV